MEILATLKNPRTGEKRKIILSDIIKSYTWLNEHVNKNYYEIDKVKYYVFSTLFISSTKFCQILYKSDDSGTRHQSQEPEFCVIGEIKNPSFISFAIVNENNQLIEED